ncbi:hypothetical protein [Klebsiella phage phiKp_21]|nr:hypothetical protein CPT_Muenster_158 [Klebsiella phage Muenster]UYL05363.1 hypothetical protein DIDNDMLP_00378 [Klebsiella phage KP13-7]BEH88310.1 hypothetical protein [Klebsiella phage phiKp_21]
MKVQIQHSIVQDMSVVKFNNLHDFFRCIDFLDNSCLEYDMIKYSSVLDTASIRVNELVLHKFSKRFGIGK